jgi:hypothetical protein
MEGQPGIGIAEDEGLRGWNCWEEVVTDRDAGTSSVRRIVRRTIVDLVQQAPDFNRKVDNGS